MVQNNYFQAFTKAIARIYHANGAVVGAGFLVSERHLITCAHVVATALGISQNVRDMPVASVELDFPLIAPGQKVKSKVVFWLPVDSSQAQEDIAGLELQGEVSNPAQPIPLITLENFYDRPFRIFGFPQQHPNGIWADGVLKDRLANGWVQMQGNSAQGHRVEPGFSGAPIWDDVENAVVGMAIAAETDEQKKVAFLLPTHVLFSAWKELSQLNSIKMISSSNLSTVQKLTLAQRLRKESLEKRLAGLTKDYQDLERDYQESGDSDQKNRFQLKLDRKLEEIEELETKLQQLEKSEQEEQKKN